MWGIGVDADQSYVNKRVLTSAQKKVDVAVYTAIANLQKGKFAGGDEPALQRCERRRRPRQDQQGRPARRSASRPRRSQMLIAHGKIKPPTQCSPNPNC